MAWPAVLDSAQTSIHELEIALRLLLAAAAGAVIGVEREIKERPAGLRTNMLVALAAAVFTILTFEIYAVHKASNSDPIRIIEAVTAGVAFLAAGTIIQNRRGVQGLTTGAAMWMCGALGVCCGAGYYALAVIATVLTVAILVALKRLDALLQSGTRSDDAASGASRARDPAPGGA
jgi:putative Mg2+ transporter-C (MgtC) family protein